MTPDEWAEVFNAGAASYNIAGVPLVNALAAMQDKCREIADRGRGPQEDHFMGKPVSKLTYEEAVIFRRYLEESNTRFISEDTSRVISQIIAAGPEPDRPDSISILPPTVLIQGGRDRDG